MDNPDTRRSADAVVDQRPVAVRFDCPWCGKRNRVDIGCFAWEDLMRRAEACECGALQAAGGAGSGHRARLVSTLLFAVYGCML